MKIETRLAKDIDAFFYLRARGVNKETAKTLSENQRRPAVGHNI